MFKDSIVNVGKYFQLPNPGLKIYFGKQREGQPVEFRTTFYKDSSLQEVLNGWGSQLEKISNEWPTLFDFENDLAKKVGPLSVMKPLAERIPDIDSYYEAILVPQRPISNSAISAVLKEWSHVRGMVPRSQSLTVEKMKKSTNSGSPYFAKRRDVLEKTIPCRASEVNGEVILHLPKGMWQSCAVLGWRGQEGGPLPEDVKQRVIWMFPLSVNIEELQVYQVLIEGAQRYNLVPSWVGLEAVDKHITSMFDTKDPNDDVVCTDFTKFDQHFGHSCQKAAETILGGLLSTGHAQVWLEQVFPLKYMMPIMYDYGKVRTGRHGMGSGSGGTNADETLVHRALQYEAAISANARLNLYSQCLGDDGVLTYPGINVDQVVASYASHGLEMNPEKQYVSKDDCTYLRRWHHKDYREGGVCVGVYSTYRALGRLCEQERYYKPQFWGPKMVALRQLSIIENVKYHPLRNEFVEYCMKGDKFRLGLDIPGFLDNIESIAQESIDYMPDFLGYTRTLELKSEVGISDWWIVKYLRSRA